MSDPAKALATQLANIEAKTGKKLAELKKLVAKSGLTKHSEIRDMLKDKLGLGHGDANTLAHMAKAEDTSATTAASDPQALAQVVDGLYAGPKAALRPIHDKLMKQLQKLGEFEISPKKTYLSLRRKKQFAMVGPATNTRVEVGLNVKSLPESDRLKVMPEKSMCQYTCKLTDAAEVDAELYGWIKQAYDAAG